MSHWILIVYGRPVSYMNFQRLTEEYQSTDEYSEQMEQFNTLLNEQLDAKYVDTNIASIPDYNWLSIDELDTKFDN